MTPGALKTPKQNKSKTLSPVPSADVALASLKSAYRHWREFLRTNGIGNRQPDQPSTQRVAACFRNFGCDETADAERVNRLVLAVDRSKSLIDSALSWQRPHIGASGNGTDQARGAQWRLVIAWCGLEELIQTIMDDLRRGAIDRFVSDCQLPAFSRLDAPKENAKLKEWRRSHAKSSGQDILQFLDARKQGRELFVQWLVKGKPLKTRTDALCLAQALRHATAHGALSATKVREWGMLPAFKRLVPEIGAVCAAAIEQLIASSGEGHQLGKNRSDDGKIRALSVRQPHAEAIIRGIKPIEFRTRATKVRGRVYIYASYSRYSAAEEDEMMQEYGLEDVKCEKLQRGVVIGSVELHDCGGEPGDHHWHLRNPQRLKKPRTPDNHPQPTWFTPFQT